MLIWSGVPECFFAESSQIAHLPGFVGVKGGADFFHVGSVRADRFVELVAGDTKLFGPIGDVGGHLGIDLFQVVRSFCMFFRVWCGAHELWVHRGARTYVLSPYGSVRLMSSG
jgi:hypothetical protein